MPYSFTKIEKDKSKIIGFVFFFLIGIYFVCFWSITTFVKNYFAFQENSRGYSFISLDIFESLGILMVAAFIGAGHWLYTTSNIIPRISSILKVEPPNKKDQYHQMFLNIVEEVSVATGGRTIEPVVVPSMSMNAFSLADFEGRAMIGVTEGLLSRLTRAQLEAVVGHEAAHIVCGDSLPTTVCVSMFNLYGGLLTGLERMLSSQRRSSSRRGGLAGLLIIIYIILVMTRFFSRLVAMFISREREYRADAVSVRLTRDPLALAEALYAITSRWRGAGLPAQELEAIFIVNPAYSSLDEQTGVFSDLFSTHPSVENRLKILLELAHSSIDSLEMNLEKKIHKSRIFLNESVQEFPFDGQSQPLSMLPQNGDHGLRCPRCHGPLNKQDYEGIEIDQCPFCRGVLVNQKDIEKLILRQEIGFPEQITRIAEGIRKEQLIWRDEKIKKDPKTLHICPTCQKETVKMVRMFYSVAYHVEIDKCVFCDTIWFDKDEMEVLQCLIEQYMRGQKTF